MSDKYETVELGTERRSVIRCVECRRWVDASGGVVLHAKHCDSASDVEHLTAMSARARRSDGLVTQAFHGDERAVVDAVRLGMLSVSDAMNRDD